MPYPTITVSGTAYERGEQYGRLARERVLRSIRSYAGVIEKSSGVGWDEMRSRAVRYRGIIESETDYLPELQGIADGAGVSLDDIVALNSRTELLAEAFIDASPQQRKTDGCTSLAVLGSATQGGVTLLSQNWDWLTHSVDTLVVLRVLRDDGPSYITVAEAGLLAKAGLNSAGLGLCTNFLLTDRDGTMDGLPYHLTLRALLDAETLPEALNTLLQHRRASSANYLLAHSDGVAVDIEVTPGGPEGVHVRLPEGDVVTHANHFCTSGLSGDLSVSASPDSPFRQGRVDALIRDQFGNLTVDLLQKILADHASFPRSICAHADLREPEHERETTALGLVMDVAARRMFISDGNPCAADWRELDSASILTDTRAEPALRAPALLG